MSMFCNINLGNIYVNEVPDRFTTSLKRERGSPGYEEDNLLNVIDYLYRFAFIDLMTGLKNRNAYEETMRYYRSTPSKLAGLYVVVRWFSRYLVWSKRFPV